MSKKNNLDLSVIILSFNTRDLLRQCLKAVYASNLGKYEQEVIVCDNGSQDQSLAMVKKEFPQAVVIANHGNIGFAAGNNPGIKRAKGRYILLLNSDTEVNPATFKTIVDYLEHHNEVGAATCKLVLPDGTMDPACHRGFPTPWAAFTYFGGLEKLFPHSAIFSQYHQTSKDLNTIHEVDMISGAFFLVKREVIKQIGLLDEDYFFYGEDMDWCFRMKRAGWKIIFNPNVTVLHRKKQSGRAHLDQKRRLGTEIFFFKYNKLFYQKNYDKRYPRVLMCLIYFLFDLRIFLLEKLKV